MLEKNYPIKLNNKYVFGYESKYSIFTTISPQDFLDLASTIGTPKEGSLAFFAEKIKKGEPLEPAFLRVNAKGEVVGHEGRHRSLAALKQGIQKIPVSIQFFDDLIYPSSVRKNESDYDLVNKLEKPKPNWVDFVGKVQQEKAVLPKFCAKAGSSATCTLLTQADADRPQKIKILSFRLNHFETDLDEK